MFIDFEGIDGSGKTTLSNRLARALRGRGYRVAHAREGGQLQSATARRVRELTRDPQLLELSPRAELFLNLARDCQQLEEVIRPALERGEVCITDRYLYSQLALSSAGRGLPEEEVSGALALTAQGTWPDLVVLVDVDPDLARMRKRLGKIAEGRDRQGESRKGLAGQGLAVRMREAFLALARRDPARWLVVENDDQPLWRLEQLVTAEVVARMRGVERPARRAAPPRAIRPKVAVDSVEERFFQLLDELESREPALAVLLLEGLPTPAAHQRRLAHAESHPRLVARSLAGLRDPLSDELRLLLAPRVPGEVALSLGSDPRPEACALRCELFDSAPEEAVQGLKGLDTPDAWVLRERAWALGHQEAVLAGLAMVEGEQAWRFRRLGLRHGRSAAVARSLTGLTSERADRLRERLYPRDRLAVLRSLAGIDSPLAERIRTGLFELGACKPVLRTMAGVAAPYATALRERAAPHTKEALDSVDGMDTGEAWSLRRRYWPKWPKTAVSSLKELGPSERGRALVAEVLEAAPRLPVIAAAYAVLTDARPPRPLAVRSAPAGAEPPERAEAR